MNVARMFRPNIWPASKLWLSTYQPLTRWYTMPSLLYPVYLIWRERNTLNPKTPSWLMGVPNSMGVSSTKAPARGGGTGSGRRNSWPSLGEILFWYQSPSPAVLGWPVLESMATAFATEMKEVLAEIKRLHQKHICLAQEAEDAEKERERMSNWVHDLMDQRYEIKAEIWRLEQDLNSKKRNWHSWKPEKKSWKPLVWKVQ